MISCLFIKRWSIGLVSLFLAFAALEAQEAPSPSPIPPLRLRIVAANLTSGRLQSYDPGHGARILQGLHPDVVLLQEFRSGTNTEREAAEWVRAVFGPDFAWYCEEGELPNGVISRFPIVASGEWDDPTQVNRDFAWARIDLPGPIDLWAVSVHLSAGNERKRVEAAKALAKEIQSHVPAGAYLVIGGDCNTGNRRETAIRALDRVVSTQGTPPADESGNEATNAKRNKPYDWVMPNVALEKYLVPVSLGGSTGGLVFDSRVYQDLNRVTPVMVGDSAAENMQHMAVVRDFLLPPPAP